MFFAVLAVGTASADVDPCSQRLTTPADVRALPVIQGDHTDEHGRAICAWLVSAGTQPLSLATRQQGGVPGADRLVVRRADGKPLDVLTSESTTAVSLPPTFLLEIATQDPSGPEGLMATLSVSEPGLQVMITPTPSLLQ